MWFFMKQSVSDEDGLMNQVINSQKWSGYSKVTRISTVKLSPDIDFLQIDANKRNIVGYEFKLIKYNKVWKKANLMPMYTGLGQAFHYFQFGVDRSFLVLGMSEDIPSEALNIALNKVEEFAQTFISLQTIQTIYSRTIGLRCFGFYMWHDNSLKNILYASSDFPISRDTKHLKECLLREQFKYSNYFTHL